jgi:O-antigen ligase/Flp pilus assembly protein TadD
MPTDHSASMEEKSIFDRVIRGSFVLLILLVPLFFSFELTTYTLPKVVLSQILVCLILAAWLLRMFFRGELFFAPSMLFLPMLLYLVISLVSFFHAVSLPGGISLLWQVLCYGVIYFIVINHVQEEKMERWALLMSLAGVVVSGYGILQFFGIEPLLKGYPYIPHIPFSTLGHRNQAAQYLMLLIPLAGVFTLLTASWIRRVIFGLSSLMMIYHFYLTKSRGGWLGLLVALLLLLGVLLYHWLSNFPFFQRRKWLFPLGLVFLILSPVFFVLWPIPITLTAKHLHPMGYYIHSIDGSKIIPDQPFRIEFDYRVHRGDSRNVGYVNLFGENIRSTPIHLTSEKGGEKGGWNHIRREDIRFPRTPYEETIKLRWVPESEGARVQFRKVKVETKEGVSLIKDSFLDRFFSRLGVTELDKTLSTQARLYMYRNTIEMIKDNFLRGVGFGNFKYVYPRYRDRGEWALSGLNTRVEQAHSEYLQIFSEVGLIGFLAFLWILTGIGRMVWEVVRRFDSSPQCVKGLALSMGIVGTLIQSFFDFNLQNPASGITFWMVVGFLELIYRSMKKAQGIREPKAFYVSIPSKGLRRISSLMVVICLAGGLYYSVRPVIGDYYLKQGRIYSQMKDWEMAFFSFDKASRFSPYNFDIYFHLGQTCDMLKQYERAVDYYRRAIELHPYFIEARNNLGAVHIRLGSIDEAIDEFKGSIEINPYHPGLHNNLGYLYGKRNLIKQALGAYYKALELDPENPEVHKNLGLIYYYKVRDEEKAIAFWEKYLRLNPDDPQNLSIQEKIEEMKRGGRSSHPQ